MGGVAEDAGFEPARRSSRRPPFSRRLPFRARPILPARQRFPVPRVVEAPGVEPGSSRHQRAAQTAVLHLGVDARRARDSNARRDLGPGPRGSNPVPCLARPALQGACPRQESNLYARHRGRAGLSRVRLPFRHGGVAARRGFEPRISAIRARCRASWTNGHREGRLPVQGSNLGSRIQSPACCQLHQPGMCVPPPGFEPGLAAA